MSKIFKKIWYAITLRCPTCGSWEHILHRREAIPRAWVIDGLAMAPGPDTLYRAVHYADGAFRVPTPTIDLCEQCGRDGHCPHRCQMHSWCHDCDGDNCGGGCRDDKTCPKRMRVIETGEYPWDLYPDEWPAGTAEKKAEERELFKEFDEL